MKDDEKHEDSYANKLTQDGRKQIHLQDAYQPPKHENKDHTDKDVEGNRTSQQLIDLIHQVADNQYVENIPDAYGQKSYFEKIEAHLDS